MCSCTLFFKCRIFTLVAASISVLTAAIKFSCFSSNDIGLRCFFMSYTSSLNLTDQTKKL